MHIIAYFGSVWYDFVAQGKLFCLQLNLNYPFLTFFSFHSFLVGFFSLVFSFHLFSLSLTYWFCCGKVLLRIYYGIPCWSIDWFIVQPTFCNLVSFMLLFYVFYAFYAAMFPILSIVRIYNIHNIYRNAVWKWAEEGVLFKFIL